MTLSGVYTDDAAQVRTIYCKVQLPAVFELGTSFAVCEPVNVNHCSNDVGTGLSSGRRAGTHNSTVLPAAVTAPGQRMIEDDSD